MFDYTQCTINELKLYCQEYGFKTSGNKSLLIYRLNNPDEPSNKAGKNKGEKSEVITIQEIFRFNKDKEYQKLTEIFGNQASEGVTVLDPITKEKIEDPKNIKMGQQLRIR